MRTFADYEGSKGKSEIPTRADVYWAWFDPQGVMNQERALRAIPAALPVLYIAPTGDFPALRKANPGFFSLLSSKTQRRYLEPDATHTTAPAVAVPQIA